MAKISNTNNGKTLYLDNVQISYEAKSGKLFMMAKDKDFPNGFRMNVDSNRELKELAKKFGLEKSRMSPTLNLDFIPRDSFRLGYSQNRQIDIDMRENLYIVGSPGTGKTVLTEIIMEQALGRDIDVTRIDPCEDGKPVGIVLKDLAGKFVDAVLNSEKKERGIKEVLIVENLTEEYAPARVVLNKILEIEDSGLFIVLSDQYVTTDDYLKFEKRIVSTRKWTAPYEVFSDNPTAQEKFKQCSDLGTGTFFDGERSFNGYMPMKYSNKSF